MLLMIKNMFMFAILSVVVFWGENGINVLFFSLLYYVNANADSLDRWVDIDYDSFGLYYYFAVDSYNF